MRRYGLVIGNSAYESEPLDNAVNDAVAVYKALQNRDYDVRLIHNATREQMEDAVSALKNKLKPGDILFFFFAGHAYEHLGYGYLLPVDTPGFTAGAIRHYAYPVEELLRETQSLEIARVIVLDACRVAFDEADHSFRTTIESIHEDRAKGEKNQRNLLLSYSTSYGEVASDGAGNNSPFTKTLTTLLLNHRLGIEEVFKEVGYLVTRSTKNQQRPWFYSSLESEIKMSDLPTYQQWHSYYARTGGSLNALAGSRNKCKLLLVGDSPTFYIIDGHGPERTARCNGGVKAACVSNSGAIYFLSSDGGLVIPHLEKEINLHHIDPIGITVSNNGKFVLVYGGQAFVVFRIGASSCKCIHEVHVKDQYFYCAEFIDDSEAWVGGDGQNIHMVQLIPAGVISSTIDLTFSDYVYAIAPHTSDLVLLTTSNGRVYMINRKAKVAGVVVSLGENVRLPSSRRSCLVNISDDQLINRFLFSPKSIKRRDLLSLGEHLQSNNLLYIAHSNTLPLIAIGSSEGIITILDTRNWDGYQEIDASGGRETELTGLAFTANNTLVVATKDHHVLFYAPIKEDYLTSLDYVDSLN
ncbi:caspase family protein [Stutzerimonas nitrititolerans]